MPPIALTRDAVLEHSGQLSSFPRVVLDILATVDDPDGCFKVLVACISHDPIIAARVLAEANTAAVRMRRQEVVTDIYTATSLVGMGRVREIALVGSLAPFLCSMAGEPASTRLWQHSVAVGVCCQEILLHTGAPVSTDDAMIAGLMHDLGQFWFYHFDNEAYRHCWRQARARAGDIEAVERDCFGVDHSTVGAWLAEHWQVPPAICEAIRGHHTPPGAAHNPLVALVTVAEVLSHALELGGGEEHHVVSLSAASCQSIGLVWDEGAQTLFGRVEARTRYANGYFLNAG